MYGEHIWGAGKDISNTIYLTIGKGVGGGAIVEGKLVHGMLHPEMGHIFVNRHPRDKLCRKLPFHGGNCLEGMASEMALERRWGVEFKDIPENHPAWDMEAFYIAHALVNYILVLSPEKIIIGGEIIKRGNLLTLIKERVVKTSK